MANYYEYSAPIGSNPLSALTEHSNASCDAYPYLKEYESVPYDGKIDKMIALTAIKTINKSVEWENQTASIIDKEGNLQYSLLYVQLKDNLIGYVAYNKSKEDSNQIQIRLIAVHKSFQKQRAGSFLLEELIKRVRIIGITSLIVDLKGDDLKLKSFFYCLNTSFLKIKIEDKEQVEHESIKEKTCLGLSIYYKLLNSYECILFYANNQQEGAQDAIKEINVSIGWENKTKDIITQYMISRTILYVQLNGGLFLIGYAAYNKVEKSNQFRMSHIAVHQAFQRKGVGSFLMGELTKKIIKLKGEKLSVEFHDPKLKSFFEKVQKKTKLVIDDVYIPLKKENQGALGGLTRTYSKRNLSFLNEK